MTAWLERHEKVEQHAIAIEAVQHGSHQNAPRKHATKPIGPPCMGTHNVKMAKHPSTRSVQFDDIIKEYGAMNILDTLGDLIT